jgi:hypothetical protein
MSRYTEADFGQVVDQAFTIDEFVQKNLMANYYRVIPRDDFPDVTLARLLRWACTSGVNGLVLHSPSQYHSV